MSTEDTAPAPLTPAQQAEYMLRPRHCMMPSVYTYNSKCLQPLRAMRTRPLAFGVMVTHHDTLWCQFHGRVAWEHSSPRVVR